MAELGQILSPTMPSAQRTPFPDVITTCISSPPLAFNYMGQEQKNAHHNTGVY